MGSTPVGDSILDFDPNGAETPVYALWTGSVLEAKARRGGLITKFSNAECASLWRLTPNGWERIALKHPSAHNDACTLCLRNGVIDQWREAILKETERWYGHSASRTVNDIPTGAGEKRAWCFERRGRKLTDPLKLHFICPECRDATGWY